MSVKVKRPGRPAVADADRAIAKTIRLPPQLDAEIEDYRAGRLDGPDYSTAARELLAAGLAAAKPKRKSKASGR